MASPGRFGSAREVLRELSALDLEEWRIFLRLYPCDFQVQQSMIAQQTQMIAATNGTSIPLDELMPIGETIAELAERADKNDPREMLMRMPGGLAALERIEGLASKNSGEEVD